MNESILTFRCYRKKYNFRKLKKHNNNDYIHKYNYTN